MSEATMAELVFQPEKAYRKRAEPDWSRVDIERQQNGVTRYQKRKGHMIHRTDSYVGVSFK